MVDEGNIIWGFGKPLFMVCDRDSEICDRDGKNSSGNSKIGSGNSKLGSGNSKIGGGNGAAPGGCLFTKVYWANSCLIYYLSRSLPGKVQFDDFLLLKPVQCIFQLFILAIVLIFFGLLDNNIGGDAEPFKGLAVISANIDGTDMDQAAAGKAVFA